MKEIYDLQREFLSTVLVTEASRGYHFQRSNFPVDLDDGFDQQRLKSAAWCVVEEIQEFKSALQEDKTDEAQEEVVDIICFSVNLGLMTEVFAGPIPGGRAGDFDIAIYHLGLAMNELKNRPHRASITQTDARVFRGHMTMFLGYIFAGAEYYLGGREEITQAYLKKRNINIERQSNGY